MRVHGRRPEEWREYEKITWGKLAPDTPRFIVESDATIVAPLIFAYVLGW